jgi:hypothetical protein
MVLPRSAARQSALEGWAGKRECVPEVPGAPEVIEVIGTWVREEQVSRWMHYTGWGDKELTGAEIETGVYL